MRKENGLLKNVFNRDRVYAFARIYAYFFTFTFTMKLMDFIPEKYFNESLAASIVFGSWYAYLLKYVRQDSKQFSDVIEQFVSNKYCQKFPLQDITCRILLYLIGMIPLLAIAFIVTFLFGRLSDLGRIWFNTYLVVLAVVIFLSSDEEQKGQD